MLKINYCFIFYKMYENAPLRSKFAESKNPEFMLISKGL